MPGSSCWPPSLAAWRSPGLQLFFNIYLRSRNFDLDFIGLINAIPAAAALVVGVPMGMLSDRMGRRRAMFIGLGLSTLAAWGMVSATSRELMLVMACLKGMADSLYMLSQAPFMMRAAGEKERTLLFSLNFGLTTIAGAVGNLLAGQLPAWFGHWLGVGAESPLAYQAVLTVSVLSGGLSLVPVWLIREMKWPGARREPPVGLEDFRKLLRPSVLRLAAPNFIIGFGAAILIPYMNLFFKGRFAVPDAQLGLLFSLSAALTGIATVIGPSIAHRLDSKIKAVVLTQGASLFFLLVMGFVPSFGLAGGRLFAARRADEYGQPALLGLFHGAYLRARARRGEQRDDADVGSGLDGGPLSFGRSAGALGVWPAVCPDRHPLRGGHRPDVAVL